MSLITSLLLTVILLVINLRNSEQTHEMGEYSIMDDNEFPILDQATSHRISIRGEVQDPNDSKSMKDNSNCHALPSEIHVTKEETDESGNVVRVCEGTIQVAKCEGTCNSELRPSVHSPNGFAKECRCCRESIMKMKRFHLSECFNPDGVRITDPEKNNMMIQLKEPGSCSCHDCGL